MMLWGLGRMVMINPILEKRNEALRGKQACLGTISLLEGETEVFKVKSLQWSFQLPTIQCSFSHKSSLNHKGLNWLLPPICLKFAELSDQVKEAETYVQKKMFSISRSRASYFTCNILLENKVENASSLLERVEGRQPISDLRKLV